MELGFRDLTQILVMVLLPLALTYIFSAFVGLERQNVGKAAGLSAHVLVAMGAAGIAVMQHLMFDYQIGLQQGGLTITPEQQRRVNIFFDHFYNRVIHYSTDPNSKVNVPYNFNTPERWKKEFADAGLEEEKVVHLGVDQPTVPEYHTLHVLRVK